jgi:hypothetical protein
MKIKLNSARSSRDRFYLIRDGRGMGGYGNPPDHYSHQWVVANGIDRGNGYQGYFSVDYVLSGELTWIPEEVRAAIRKHLNL